MGWLVSWHGEVVRELANGLGDTQEPSTAKTPMGPSGVLDESRQTLRPLVNSTKRAGGPTTLVVY